eukprot:6205808-Pleurochrysis_carterae.AAC.2
MEARAPTSVAVILATSRRCVGAAACDALQLERAHVRAASGPSHDHRARQGEAALARRHGLQLHVHYAPRPRRAGCSHAPLGEGAAGERAPWVFARLAGWDGESGLLLLRTEMVVADLTNDELKLGYFSPMDGWSMRCLPNLHACARASQMHARTHERVEHARARFRMRTHTHTLANT